MYKINLSLIEEAKKAKSPEALMSLATENGITLTRESATAYYGRLHRSGELSDEELDNVAGGGCGGGNDSAAAGGDRVLIREHRRLPDGSDHVGHSGVLCYANARYSVKCDCGAPAVGINGPESVVKL